MNTRIDKLAEQAAIETSTPQFSHMGFKERFAELIVRECANIAKEEQEFNNLYTRDMVNIDQSILIRFGL